MPSAREAGSMPSSGGSRRACEVGTVSVATTSRGVATTRDARRDTSAPPDQRARAEQRVSRCELDDVSRRDDHSRRMHRMKD